MGKIKRRRRRKRIIKTALVLSIGLFFLILFITFLLATFLPRVYYNYDFERLERLKTLTPSTLKAENFYYNPYLKYEDKTYTSKVGIDVSSHQKTIDFEKVKKSGIEFVYLRYGYRGYQTGELQKDAYFEEYYQKAKRANLEVGVYFFSQATSILEAMDEAYFVLEGILDKEIDLPIVYDLEGIDYDKSRIDDTSNEERTDFALAFALKVKENGYEPAIYTNLNWSQNVYDLHLITHYKIWMAQYADSLGYPYETYMWQYTDQGKVEGISTPVDLNIMFIKK